VTIASAEQLTNGVQVVEVMGASRDGKWLMYDSDLSGNADIYRIATTGGRPENLTEDPRREFAPDLSPDNTEFAWHRYIGITRRLFVRKIDGDSAQEITSVQGDNGVPRWSPDGKAIVAWSHDNETGAVFVLHRDAKGQWMRPSWRLNYGQLPIWSNDGKSVAFVRLDGRVQSIPADSGAVRTLYEPKPGDPLAVYLVWSKNPDTIWMVGQRDNNQAIWALSLRTGRPRLLVKLDDSIGKTIGPGFAADSSRFYFPINERFSNVRWAELNSR
jgi:Tol biopolymer transport system component